MNKIRVLVTGGGSPGIAGTIYSLKNNYDNRIVDIICTDAKNNCVGKYLSEKFYKIPRADNAVQYLEKIISICKEENIDVILPQNTAELIVLSENKNILNDINVQVVISELSNISIANNKYKLLEICKQNSIPYPEYFLIDNINDLAIACEKLGWPEKSVVIKRPDGNGSRGIRIIDERKDYKDLFYNYKPTNLYTTYENFSKLIGNNFNPLIVMEYLSGNEVSIDLFKNKKKFISIPRIREEIRSGISFQNTAIKDDELIKYSKKLSDIIDLKYCFGFQFKYDENNIPKILECNPRVQGTMIFATMMGANIIYSSVKDCLNEDIPEFNLDWNTELLRYWGAIGINENIIKV